MESYYQQIGEHLKEVNSEVSLGCYQQFKRYLKQKMYYDREFDWNDFNREHRDKNHKFVNI